MPCRGLYGLWSVYNALYGVFVLGCYVGTGTGLKRLVGACSVTWGYCMRSYPAGLAVVRSSGPLIGCRFAGLRCGSFRGTVSGSCSGSLLRGACFHWSYQFKKYHAPGVLRIPGVPPVFGSGRLFLWLVVTFPALIPNFAGLAGRLRWSRGLQQFRVRAYGFRQSPGNGSGKRNSSMACVMLLGQQKSETRKHFHVRVARCSSG